MLVYAKIAGSCVHCKLVLPLPVFVRNQEVAVRNKIMHSHSLTPGITARHGDVSAQSHHVFKLGGNPQETDYISIVQFARQSFLIEREFLCPADMMVVDPLHYGMLTGRRIRKASRVSNHLTQC